MSYFNRNKWWAIAFLILVALNIATLAAFWILKDKQEVNQPGMRSGAADFLVKELGFDSVQKQQLQSLILEHRMQVAEVRRNNREAKDSFFSLLKEPNIDDATLAVAVRNATQPDQLMEIHTFRHFQKIRALCTDVQKRKFDTIIHEVLRMNAPPGNGGPPPFRGDGPPRGEGPPPGP